MLAVFSPIFVADTKITFVYSFVAPLNNSYNLPNAFINPIQCGIFRGCLQIGDGKKAPPPSLKPVTHILQ